MNKKLGRYELVEPLGQGGMGEVWLARLQGAGGFQKPAIVKTVLPTLAKDEQFVQRFLHEGKVLVHLSHSNIAQVYDLDQTEGVLFMALEYVAGIDVARLVSQVARHDELIPVPVALFIAWQAAEGLAYAHGKADPNGAAMGIVHRDVSPQNVMVSYEGEVKVIDFGIARSTARAHATQATMVMGKLGYMAPEQALGESVDARADQYALGVLLWELLAGRHYVPAGTTAEMMAAMASPKRQPLPPLRLQVDPGLEAVVQKALSRAPADRHPTTEDLSRALLAELNRLGQPTRKQVGDWVKLKCSADYATNQRLLSRLSTFSSKETAPAAVRLRRTPLIAAGLFALAVLGGGLWWIKGGGTAEVPLPPPAQIGVEPDAGTLAGTDKDAADAVLPKPELPVAAEAVKPDSGAGLPAAPLPAINQSPAPEALPPATRKVALNASVSLVQGPRRAVRLKNNGDFTFTRCVVFIPGQRLAGFASLPAGMSREIVLDAFNQNSSAPVLDDQVRLTCAQGSVTLPAQ